MQAAASAGQRLTLTPLKAVFDAPGAYRLGVAVDGQPAFFPLDVLPEPVPESQEEVTP